MGTLTFKVVKIALEGWKNHLTPSHFNGSDLMFLKRENSALGAIVRSGRIALWLMLL